MIEEIVDVATRDGAMETFIVRPDRSDPGSEGPFPAILLLMDAPGVRQELYDMASRLASVGYVVAVPNLYYRAGTDSTFGPDVLEKGSDDFTRMRAIRTKMTIPPVMNDVEDLIAHLDAQEAVAAGPIGCHGYCMSGPYALAAAAHFPDRVAAAASFYGTWLVSTAEESPHLTFGQAAGELYISCAEHDDLAPPEMVEELTSHFASSGARGELEIQSEVHHGFAFPSRWCFDRDAAERHWERLIALYRRNLG